MLPVWSICKKILYFLFLFDFWIHDLQFTIVAQNRLKFVTKLVKSQVQLMALPRSSEKSSQRIWTKYLPQCWYKNWANWFEKLRLWCLNARWNRKICPVKQPADKNRRKWEITRRLVATVTTKAPLLNHLEIKQRNFRAVSFFSAFRRTKVNVSRVIHQETFCFDLMEFSQWAGSWFFAKTFRGKFYFRRHLFSACWNG